MTDYTTISIPKDLHEDVDEFIDDTNFTSVAEFTKHLLRDTISGGDLTGSSDLTEDEVEKVRDRLKNLGYIE
jgi:Arc/MetJ-type ribon-helix-helix transcriptional regulator